MDHYVVLYPLWGFRAHRWNKWSALRVSQLDEGAAARLDPSSMAVFQRPKDIHVPNLLNEAVRLAEGWYHDAHNNVKCVYGAKQPGSDVTTALDHSTYQSEQASESSKAPLEVIHASTAVIKRQ